MTVEQLIWMSEKALIALLALIAYLYLVCSVFPWLTMRLLWRGKSVSARGLRRVSFPEGRGVIYEPDLHVRRFIPRYALILHEENKFLQCQVDPRAAYLRYDVISFDRTGRLLDIVKVSERLTGDGYSRRVLLPTDTSRAYIVLRQVDGMYKSRRLASRYSFWGIGIFCGLTVISTMVCGWLLYQGIGTVWLTLLPSIAPITASEILWTGFGWGLAVSAWTVFRYMIRMIKVVNK